jgi:hypothetical protein
MGVADELSGAPHRLTIDDPAGITAGLLHPSRTIDDPRGSHSRPGRRGPRPSSSSTRGRPLPAHEGGGSLICGVGVRQDLQVRSRVTQPECRHDPVVTYGERASTRGHNTWTPLCPGCGLGQASETHVPRTR